MSPFQYSYSTEINKGFNHDNYHVEVSIIKEYIEKRRGIVKLIENDRLIFKGMNIRNNVFCQIKFGYFNIEQKREKLFLTYKIEFEKTVFYFFFLGILIGILLLIFFPKIWTFCIPLLVMGGGNWAITLIRNGLVLNDIVLLINNLKKEKSIE